MAMWPAFALAAASLIAKSSLRPAIVALAALCALGLVICAWLLASPPHLGTSAAIADRATAWTTLAGFGPEVWLGLSRIGIGCFALALAACVVGIFVPRRAFAALATAAGHFFSLSAILGYALVAPYFSLADAAPHPAQTSAGAGPRCLRWRYRHGKQPAFLHEPRHRAARAKSEHGIRHARIRHWPRKIPRRCRFATLWASGRPLAFVTELSARPRWEAKLGPLPSRSSCAARRRCLFRSLVNSHWSLVAPPHRKPMTNT